MRGFAFFLSFKEPKVYFARTQQNVVRLPFEVKRGKNVIRPVANFVDDRLDWLVGLDIPNFNHFVSTQRNQVILLFVDS